MMKKRSLLAVLLLTAAGTTWAQKSEQPLYREGQVIVKFKPAASKARGSAASGGVDAALKLVSGTKAAQLMPLSAKASAKTRGAGRSGDEASEQALSGLYVIHFDKGQPVERAVEKLKKQGDVAYAEPNYIVRAVGMAPKAQPAIPQPVAPQPEVNAVNATTATYNDPRFSEQWGLQAINMPALWEKPIVNSKRPVIAILDTGVDITHPDLKANIWTNEAEKGNDEDGNGFVGDVHGWDFIENTADISDKNNHGTHCAGIAAAVGNNGEGIVGANPNALIMPVRVLDEAGEGDVSTIIQGIDYAIANKADVISMSYGYSCPYGPSEAERDALKEASKSIVPVAAAGNLGVCMNPAHQGLHGNPNAMPVPSYPAAFTFVIGVQASTTDGLLASFSNFDCGITPPALLAPGTEPLSYELTAPGASILSTLSGGGYGLMDGTSMACPLVAGAISSLIQRRNFDSNQELLTALAMANENVVDIVAAYGVTELPQHQINDVFTSSVDGVDITFTVKSASTVQVGDGENAAIGEGVTIVRIPETVEGYKVTSIGRRAFSWTDLEEITLPNSIIYLDRESFSVADKLKSIDIPESVREIGGNAFGNCNFKELYIPKGVIVIDDFLGGAFAQCGMLERIVVDEQNPRYDSRDNCNAIIETATNTLIAGTNTIPEGVEHIGLNAFSMRGFETITIPNTVKTIGDCAFGYCPNLKEISIPESVTLIGMAAFDMCYGLTSIYIPKSVVSMHTPFHCCTNLTSLVIDPRNPVFDSRDNCNAIIETATNTLLWGYNCSHVPEGITAIGSSAFANCDKLESVTITKDITYVGECAFVQCDNLNSIVVEEGNPFYDSRDNCNAIIETATNTLIFGNHASSIPASVEIIGKTAFNGTQYNDTTIVFHEGLKTIRDNAYLLLDNVTFSLPSTINNLENDCFYVFNEGQISEVYCYRKTPLNISNYVFRAVETATLHVPKGQKEAYANAKGWKNFGTIVEMDVEGADPPIEIEPITESEVISFGGEDSAIDENTDLSNTVIDNTYFTMDADNGDGYDTEMQALVMNSTTTEEQMKAVQAAQVGDESLQESYSGIIFQVPAGKGSITVDAKTLGSHVLNVKIGSDAAQQMVSTERTSENIAYEVKEPTYVYIYASTGKTGGTRGPVVAESSVLLYGYTVTLEVLAGDADGNGVVDRRDIQAISDHILGKPSDSFRLDNADMNGDEQVDAQDIVLLVNQLK